MIRRSHVLHQRVTSTERERDIYIYIYKKAVAHVARAIFLVGALPRRNRICAVSDEESSPLFADGRCRSLTLTPREPTDSRRAAPTYASSATEGCRRRRRRREKTVHAGNIAPPSCRRRGVAWRALRPGPVRSTYPRDVLNGSLVTTGRSVGRPLITVSPPRPADVRRRPQRAVVGRPVRRRNPIDRRR